MPYALTLKFRDCEKAFRKSVMETGDGFIIDDSIDYPKDYYEKISFDRITELSSLDSIYSYKFGLSLQDEDETLANLYSCKCGHTKGLDKLDDICPICDGVVERMTFKNEGWFYIRPKEDSYFQNVKVFHPYLCYLLCTYNSGNLLKRLNGGNHFRKKSQEKLLTKIEDFTWKDILFNKEALKAFIIKYMPANAKLLLMYEDLWYTNAIPVISKSYRPTMIRNILGKPQIIQHITNPEYQVISEAVKEINENPNIIEAQLINKLKSIITTLGTIHQYIYNELSGGKKSVWRADVVAPRVDNSARLVIEAIIETTIHDLDVVQLPLDVFRVIFQKEVSDIAKEMRIPPKQIDNLVDLNYELTKEEIDLIRNIIFPRVQEPFVDIYREPCVYITSVLGMRIHSLIDEMVMRVPFFALKALAGD